MKKYLWILIPVFLLFVSGCSDEETQQISCAIQVPSDGETIQVCIPDGSRDLPQR